MRKFLVIGLLMHYPVRVLALSDAELETIVRREAVVLKAAISATEKTLWDVEKQVWAAERNGASVETLKFLKSHNANLAERLDGLKKNDLKWVGMACAPLSLERLSTGDIGTINSPFLRHLKTELEVLQVVNKTEMIVNAEVRDGESEAVRRTIWLAGLPTNDIVDGQKLSTGCSYFRVTGTKTYSTAVGGSKTVHVIAPLSADEERAIERARAFAATKAKNAIAAEAATQAAEAERAKTHAEAERTAEWNAKLAAASTMRLRDGTEIRLQDCTAMPEKYLTKDVYGKWRVVPKADVESITKPENP